MTFFRDLQKINWFAVTNCCVQNVDCLENNNNYKRHLRTDSWQGSREPCKNILQANKSWFTVCSDGYEQWWYLCSVTCYVY